MSQCFDRSELSDKKRPETVRRLWDQRGRVCAHMAEYCMSPGAGRVHESLCVCWCLCAQL